jgi:hypothetical protein
MDYIDIIEIPNPGYKTKRFLVKNLKDKIYLGVIYWRTGFRKYVFSTEYGLKFDFDSNCLKKITEFLVYETTKHYAELDKQHLRTSTSLPLSSN